MSKRNLTLVVIVILLLGALALVKTVSPRENQFIVRIELPTWPHGVFPGMTAELYD